MIKMRSLALMCIIAASCIFSGESNAAFHCSSKVETSKDMNRQSISEADGYWVAFCDVKHGLSTWESGCWIYYDSARKAAESHATEYKHHATTRKVSSGYCE